MFQNGIPAVGVRPLSPSIKHASDLMVDACPICLVDDAVDPQTTACGHVFCGECLERALAARNVCPVCRCPQQGGSSYDWVQCEATPGPEVVHQTAGNERQARSLAVQLGNYIGQTIDASMRQSLRLR